MVTSFRSLSFLSLLLAIFCTSVFSLSAENDSSLTHGSSNADTSMHKAHVSADQPAAMPIVPMNKDGKATLAVASASQLTITAQSSFSDFFSSNYNYIQVPLTWQRVVAGAVLMGFGIVLCLYGFRYLRFSLLLTGFIGGGIAAYAILLNTEPAGGWSNRVAIYVGVCIAAGLLIGVIMLGLNRFAIWILGGAGGLALGVYILSWRAGSLIHNTAGRIALMAGCAALGMFLSIFLGKMTTIFATVLIGGYMFTLGLDMFLRTGFLENTKELFRTGDDIPYQMYSGIYGMLGVLSFTFLLGYLLQPTLYFLHKRRKRRHAVPAVNGPYAPYGPNDPYGPYAPYGPCTPYGPHGPSNRDSQYGGGGPYGSQYGSQYDSRDHLGVPQNQNAPAEYTWYGKRKNPPVPANNPYSHGYNEKGYQPVYSQNNLNQPHYGAPVAQHAPVIQTAPAPVVQTASSPVLQSAPAPVVQIPSSPVLQSAPTPVVASSSQTQPTQINGAATTTGDKAIVFEEKKNWLGRTKVVPKLAESATSSSATATAAATQPAQ